MIFDPRSYTKWKNKGVASVVKQGVGQYVVQKKKFDPDDGTETVHAIIPLNVQELTDLKAYINDVRSAINTLLADIQSLG